MTKESLVTKLGPWAGATALIVVSIVQVIQAHGGDKTQTQVNTQAIQRLEDQKADRREMDDIKAWMKRLDDKMDRLNDKLDRK